MQEIYNVGLETPTADKGLLRTQIVDVFEKYVRPDISNKAKVAVNLGTIMEYKGGGGGADDADEPANTKFFRPDFNSAATDAPVAVGTMGNDAEGMAADSAALDDALSAAGDGILPGRADSKYELALFTNVSFRVFLTPDPAVGGYAKTATLPRRPPNLSRRRLYTPRRANDKLCVFDCIRRAMKMTNTKVVSMAKRYSNAGGGSMCTLRRKGLNARRNQGLRNWTKTLDESALLLEKIYNYVMKRWQGKSPEEANKEVEDESAGQPIPPQQPPPPPPHEEKGQQKSGSGLVDDEDDGGGVQLTADEMIRVPQGDRYKVFAHPCQLLIAGATKSGKTTLLMKILAQKEIMFDPVPRDVYWFYTMRSSVASVPESLPFVRLRNGVPTEDMVRAITKEGIPKMVILDDMQDVLENKNQTKMLMDILTKVSHHGNLSIVFIVQNLYNENMRKVRSQCDEIVIMGNGSSAMHNAEQMGRSLLAGKGAQYLKDCLSNARLLTPHSHLLVSSGAHTGPFSVRCGILLLVYISDSGLVWVSLSGILIKRLFKSLLTHLKDMRYNRWFTRGCTN
ncbi:hypothetical protein CAPTEDRAFT_217336 [Capitella teleta]|uniref:AAA+ ATPase domain-containing protein n=1 Tax=Capitella teleta TaxID=283909 RepID=R7UIC4_CAPTE|nr:hypothetical protein CAPTEDRAFT_217336 [Capitella teleta]|eukprot:ELU05853.1 hypothetical protein CAPTEDRAFT_217336 [Capitella teleta]